MEEHEFESGKHEITSEHAILIPALSSVNSLMPYVEAVAVVIGSCHIHSVYEDREHVKIYLKDKRFVDILVNNGISILGRQINVDYAVPRADKIILSNVDPVVPDSILMKLLCYYGNPVSSIIHEKIATSSEYCHIECGKRKVYMNIFSDKKIPTKINFTYQDMFFRIDVTVASQASEECEPLPAPAVNEEQMDDDSNDVLEVASSVNMKPDVEDIIPKTKPTEKRAYHRRGKAKANSAANMATRLKKRARKGWYGTRHVMTRNKFSPQKKEKLKLAVKKQLAAEDKGKLRKSGSVPKAEAFSLNNSVVEENPGPSNSIESKDAFDNFTADDLSEKVTQYPLSTEELMEFMKKSKFHRDPCRIAWEFLNDKTPESIEALKIQLREYCQVIKDQSIKFRIRRVIASLKYSKDAVDE